VLHIEQRGDRLDVSGASRLALCPCDAPPLSFGLSGATFTRGELFLRWPRLYVGPLPVFLLPWLWIRPPDRPAFLPPTFTLRAHDGLLLGTGVKLPFRGQDQALRTLELRAAAYLKGGAEISTRLLLPTFSGTLVWDHLQQDRFVANMHGFFRLEVRPSVGVRLDLDAIRGPRGLRATPSLDLAARPFDVGVSEISAGWTPSTSTRARLGAGLLLRGRRGEGQIVWGPTASASAQGSAGSRGAWDTNLSLVMLSGGALGSTPLGRAYARLEALPRLGPLQTNSSLQFRARLAAPSQDKTLSYDAAAEARTELALPLVRTFPIGSNNHDHLTHHIAPLAEMAASVSHSAGGFFLPNRPRLGPFLGLAALGARSSLHGSSTTFDASAHAGVLVASSGTNALARLHLEGFSSLASATAEATATTRLVGASLDLAPGLDAFSELRLGPALGSALVVDLYGRTGGAGSLARSFGSAAPLLGDAFPLLADRGLALGAGFSSPFATAFNALARVDVDARSSTLLGARASLGYRHPNGCLSLELGASFRIVRAGFDGWLLIDLVPPLPR